MTKCLQCGRDLPDSPVCISGSQLGDENTDCYYLCPKCSVYTLEHVYDDFDGETSVSVEGPVNKEKGDRAVSLIRQCAEPWDKTCRCPAHLQYFNANLD